MNLLGIFQKIQDSIKAILIGVGIASLIGTGLYIRGCQDGEARMDAKYKQEFRNAKPREVSRDTSFTPQKPDSGKYAILVEDSSSDRQAIVRYKKRVDTILKKGDELAASQATEIEGLRAKNKYLEEKLRQAYESRLVYLNTPQIGELWAWIYPADSTLRPYKHNPSPLQIITIKTELPVLEPRSTWETARDVGIGVIGGALITYAVIRVSR